MRCCSGLRHEANTLRFEFIHCNLRCARRPLPLGERAAEGSVQLKNIRPAIAMQRPAVWRRSVKRWRGDKPAPFAAAYFRWFETSLVISNIDTCFLPPKTAFSLSSALIRRLLIESCSLFFLM